MNDTSNTTNTNHNILALNTNPCLENDKLNFKPYLENTTKLINSLKHPTTISISAEYGMGKTFFAKCLQEQLQKEYPEQISPIYVDLFKNDYKDPLTVIMAEIIAQLYPKKDDTTAKNDFINKIAPVIKMISYGIIKKNTGIDLQQIQDFLNKKDIDEIADFKAELKKLCQNNKLVILIDEIDRCKPNFAIATLEIIKHFFDIDNIIFILFINPCYQQLLQQKFIGVAPKQEYGISSRGYMEKFINYNINLKALNNNDYNQQPLFTTLEGCINTTFIDDILTQFDMEKCLKYYGNRLSKHINIFIYLFNQQFVNNTLSPRDIKKIIANVKLNIDTFYNKNYQSYNIIFLFLMYTLKIKFYNEYKKLMIDKDTTLLSIFCDKIISEEYTYTIITTYNIEFFEKLFDILIIIIKDKYPLYDIDKKLRAKLKDFQHRLFKNETDYPIPTFKQWLFNIDFI